jgi:hypothetical protein
MKAWVAAIAVFLLCLSGPALAQTAPPPLVQSEGFGTFKDWAAIVVAADYHAHSGAPVEAFDNARRDLSNAFIKAGFATSHVSQFSVRPERYGAWKAQGIDPASNLLTELKRQSATTTGGCLVYFTSHGNADGIVLGKGMLTPRAMAQLLGEGCGGKPTVAVISACFSGVFIPVLAAPNRMIMTAARNDRSSFGCQEDVTYTFFDDCFLQSLAASRNFAVLFTGAQACVEKKEGAMRTGFQTEMADACGRLADVNVADRDKAIKSCAVSGGEPYPPSEPQVYVGGEVRPLLSFWRLDAKPGG